MANNTGVIFGTVTRGGSPCKDVTISLNFIFGEVALGEVRTGGGDDLKSWVKRVDTNGDGKYVLPFFWEAVDLGKVGQGSGTASVLAMDWRNDGTYDARNQRGRVFITLDIRKLIAVGYSPAPGSLPEAANIGKDFYASYKQMLPAHAGFYPSSPFLSTEVFGLLGRIDIPM